jgi:hypothetical protein
MPAAFRSFMLSKGALEDIIMQHLTRKTPGGCAAASKKVPELKKKVFLSDRDMRGLCKPGAKTVRIPANAIVSPLALDWLDYDGIEIVR